MSASSRAHRGASEDVAQRTPPEAHQARLTNPERLKALAETGLMDAEPEAAFDRFTKLAARMLGTQVALISLVDDRRQFFKSALGLAEPWASRRETPLTHSFCQFAVSSAEPLIVFDAREHPFLRDNCAVTELGVVAYAGVPLVTSNDQVLGALCVVDSQPRQWTADEVSILRDLAAMTMTEVELRRQLAALARSEAILQGVVKNLPNGAVLLFDHDLRYLMADGEALLASVGFSREALIGHTLPEVASPQSRPVVEAAYRAALAGQTQALDIPRGDKVYALTIVPVRDERGAVTAGLALVYDVTNHKRNEALARKEVNEVRSLSVKDELTGLYNRRGFLQLASERLAFAARMGRPALLFFVDLNGMKQINDRLGHEQGDRALIETADVLRATCRSSDVIARLGGDEFVALLVDGDQADLASFSERVQREIDEHNAQPDRAFRLSASIGAAAYDPEQPERVEALLARADSLMYEQKRLRKAIGKTLRPPRG